MVAPRSASRPPNRNQPQDPTRLDFADDIRVPLSLSLFTRLIPTDPCREYLQVRLSGEAGGGRPVIHYDPTAAPVGFSPELVATDLSAFRPNTS